MMQLTPNTINKRIVPEIKRNFEKKDYIKGSTLIHNFIKKIKLPQDLAEEALKIMIGEEVLLNVNRPKDIYSDYFSINKEISENYVYEFKSEEKENDEIMSQIPQLQMEQKTEVLPVFEAPPHMMGLISGNFIHQKELFKKLIIETKKEIKIISPFVDETGLSNYIYELINKCNNGVIVKILVRKDKARERAINILKSTLQSECNTVKVKSFHKLDKYGLVQSIHSKLIISDDNSAYIGSGEIRKNSLFGFLCETGVYLRGSVVKTFSSYFDIIWGEAISV